MTQKDELQKRIERANRIVTLHLEGKSYKEIGKECGISGARVGQIIKKSKHRATMNYCQDITFCSRESCGFKKCERHPRHIRWDIKPYQSIADFKNTEYCLKQKEGAENE